MSLIYLILEQNFMLNKLCARINLEGEIIQEYSYYVLGFIPAEVIKLKNDVWFSRLSNKQINLVEKYLEKPNH